MDQMFRSHSWLNFKKRRCYNLPREIVKEFDQAVLDLNFNKKFNKYEIKNLRGKVVEESSVIASEKMLSVDEGEELYPKCQSFLIPKSLSKIFNGIIRFRESESLKVPKSLKEYFKTEVFEDEDEKYEDTLDVFRKIFDSYRIFENDDTNN